MGLCCCRPRTKEPLEEYKKPTLSDIPELHPAVYIELAIPNVPSGPSSSEMSFGVEQVKDWENVVNYDNIITKFSQHTGVLTLLTVKKQDSLYCKRLCDTGEKPKPVIVATVTDPEKSGWERDLRGTLFDVINEEFGKDNYQISVIVGSSLKQNSRKNY